MRVLAGELVEVASAGLKAEGVNPRAIQAMAESGIDITQQSSKSLEELTRGLKKGILVRGFIGGNSNSTTGDFSYGIVGVLFENGKMVQPVNEMNISGNAKEFWNRLVAVGNDPFQYSWLRTPSMLFEDVNFSGV